MNFEVIVIHSECLGMEGSLFDAAALRSECLGIDISLFDAAALHSGFGEDISAQRLSTGQGYRSKDVVPGVEVYRLKILGYPPLRQA
jgi:hypothetical protein